MAQATNQFSSLLLEIGTEDIPARFIPVGMEQLRENTKTLLTENRIKFDDIKTYGSPRRLAVIVNGMSKKQDSRTREVFGPPKKIAIDANGSLTKAATGFASSQKVSPESLVIKSNDKGEYIVAVIEEKGVDVKDLLPEIMKKIVFSLKFQKSMRWADNNIRFVRPIRWLCALHDNEIIKFEIDRISSNNISAGHRFLSQGSFQINDISSYVQSLSENKVIVDLEERKKIIFEKIQSISESVNGRPIKDDLLIENVANLVEYPVPVLAAFPKEYLNLPKELLVTVMKEHQKYFAIEDRSGRLTNHFIVVSNTTENNKDNIKSGAERVIKARFEDARFYFEEDKKKTLKSRVNDLKNVTYQDKLGTLYDKTLRVKNISVYLASKINPSLKKKSEEAAMLSKTDLITGVVREFPELQGIMAKYYAVHDNEDTEAAQALSEQYYHGEKIPESDTGTILSLADKIDNITAFFSIGLIPTGSEDPFALRRQTLSLITILTNKGYSITFEDIIDFTLRNLKVKKPSEIKKSLFQFFEQRLEPLLSSQGYSYEVIQSVLSSSTQTPLSEFRMRLDAVKEFKTDSSFNDFLTAIKRVRNIIPAEKLPFLKTGLLKLESEKKLNKSLADVLPDFEEALKKKTYLDSLKILTRLTEPINNFFDNVLVMDKKKEIKLNRLSLLKKIWDNASEIADFSKL